MPEAAPRPLRVLTWNLYHGRAIPNAGRDLQAEFTAALAGWDWDVALLQEVPPWWTTPIADACGARAHAVATSRNGLPALRRVLAVRWPDVVQAQGGGANVVLVRPRAGATFDADRKRTLRWFRERRVVCGVRLAGAAWGDFDGAWIATTHAQLSVAPHPTAWADVRASLAAVRAWAGEPDVPGGADRRGAARRSAAHLRERLTAWSRRAARAASGRRRAAARAAPRDPADAVQPAPPPGTGAPPLVLGGDLNLRAGHLAADAGGDARRLPGWRLVGSEWLDHVLVRGEVDVRAREVPDRGALSDHAPLAVVLEAPAERR